MFLILCLYSLYRLPLGVGGSSVAKELQIASVLLSYSLCSYLWPYA
jgi:hypothetical protein